MIQKLSSKKESTIKKSKKDWDEYKNIAGIKDEVEQFAKNGYVEKMSFLQRTEMREFEIQREIRLKEQERKKWNTEK